MYDDEETSMQLPYVGETGMKVGPKEVVKEHNQYLQEYFESVDQKDECFLIKVLEDLDWKKEDTLH